MHGELLMLFVILLLGLILCSFLGGKGCQEGMTNGSYTGPNGSTAQIQTDSSGKNSLVITNSDGTTSTYDPSVLSSNTYTGPNEGTAQVTTGSNGNSVVQVTQKDGTVQTYTLSDTPSTSTSTTPSSNTSSTTSSNNYDNYDHYSGSSMPSIFYGPNGGTAKVINTPNNNSIVITNKNGTTEIYYIDNNTSSATATTYYGPNGGSAKIITGSDGKTAVQITSPSGSIVVYTATNAYTYNSQDDTINQYSSDTNTTGSDYNSAFSANSYTGPNGGQATTISGPSGNTYSTYDSSAYSNSLPQGIPKSQIPPGDEDLYILKSQVVPPVCPKCPTPIIQSSNSSGSGGSSSGSTDNTKCPPCPPCARCPEPAFDCKKVPNYGAFNPSYMPMPVVSDFSTFGM